jgi:ABC-type uncharacterized transport system involved in gliding motility auxiliary subunit
MQGRLQPFANRVYNRIKFLAHPISIVGLAALAAGAIRWLIFSQYDTIVQALLAMGLALVGLFILTRPDEIKTALAGRTARYGSNAVLMSVAFLGILVLLNVVLARHSYRYDSTAAKEHTISPQTIQILNGLTEPVQILGFFAPGDSRFQDAKDLLEEYQRHTDKISYEFIDPEQKPSLARMYEVTSYGTLLFIRGDKRQQTFGVDEQTLTSTLLKVSRNVQKTIYFVTGHNERDLSSSEDTGYAGAKQILEKENYQVTTLNLTTVSGPLSATIPISSVIVLASPQAPLLDKEADALLGWIQAGGKAMIMADPGRPDPLGGRLDKLGLVFQNDLAIDLTSSFFGDIATLVVAQYPFSQITRDMGGLITIFPYARSIRALENAPSTATIEPLITTGPNSWGETEYQSGQGRFDPDKDNKGPLNLAYTYLDNNTKARMVVFGNADFVANSGLSIGGQVGNADLFVNSINWLAEEEELISIRPKPPEQRMVVLTESQRRIVFYSSVVLLPLMVLGAGVFVWWRRR